MIKDTKITLIFVIGAFLSFFLDGTITQIFNLQFDNTFLMVPYLTIMWFVMAVIFLKDYDVKIMIWSFVFGYVYDSYYIGIIGIFLFIIPLIVFLTRYLLKVVNPFFFSSILIFFIDITVVMSISYCLDRLSKIASISGSPFLVFVLWPTLIFNILIYAIMYFPIQKLYNFFKIEWEN
ncbi:rod shape-determining protein MreD [Lactobacillus sp. S2-2]|uniref:rod shape-determining protein MreD n=1 Tax=Lactobacillus sp. S2-2 TaxID=2692917 RepID=UPI001F026C9A|nr:rod shape-determining protein MreD [Lactobacillus sp. S2-2]MCF6515792.1 rod shape-determining protein MreD [Lactobacillus sp. S2-2]